MNLNPPPTPFERWFVKCIAICMNDHIGPGNYVWNLQEPGVWLDLFNSDMSPAEAVASQFQRH